MEVLYKCQCMPSEVSVSVPFRPTELNVVEWIEEVVGHAIYADHRARSPLCQASVMEYIKVPTPENAPYVGGKPITN